ncbi:MAG: hypothetical protein ACE5JX_16955 [Acidobacteriota bacterium]
MRVSNQIKDFEDPLMDRVGSRAKKHCKPASKESDNGKMVRMLAAAALLAVLGTLAYFIVQAQQRIEDLNTQLLDSQQQLSGVSEQLGQSQRQIGELNEGLSKSRSQLAGQKQQLNRYKGLYSDLKSEQGQHASELEAISLKKADQSEVDALKDQAAGTQQKIGEMSTRVGQISSNIGDLRELSTRNRKDIESNQGNLELVRKSSDANAQQINAVKTSLEREYYNFELEKKGATMKVFNVALSLKGVDSKKQRYTLEIFADGKRIKKKNQSINEPIYFYVKDLKKPYEILVNRIDKKNVVGYLSIPKG